MVIVYRQRSADGRQW